VSDVFSISGRGTVATGRVERGVITKGTEVEIVGLGAHFKTTLTGVGENDPVCPLNHQLTMIRDVPQGIGPSTWLFSFPLLYT
jgi:hypothetical protein